jgi:hypothetical protein
MLLIGAASRRDRVSTAEVLLSRVAYPACFACAIELSGMRIELQSE